MGSLLPLADKQLKLECRQPYEDDDPEATSLKWSWGEARPVFTQCPLEVKRAVWRVSLEFNDCLDTGVDARTVPANVAINPAREFGIGNPYPMSSSCGNIWPA